MLNNETFSDEWGEEPTCVESWSLLEGDTAPATATGAWSAIDDQQIVSALRSGFNPTHAELPAFGL